jgi:hypothetical protein
MPGGHRAAAGGGAALLRGELGAVFAAGGHASGLRLGRGGLHHLGDIAGAAGGADLGDARGVLAPAERRAEHGDGHDRDGGQCREGQGPAQPRRRRAPAGRAILVFSLVSGYVSGVRKDVEPKTAVLVLTRAVPELQPIPPDALALKSVPEKWVGRQALRDQSQVGALVPNTALPAGVELQQGMLVEPPQLEKGQQEISILINADTGVAGKLRPGLGGRAGHLPAR